MAIPFSRSMRSLERDRFLGGGWILAVGVVLFSAWVAWFFLARIQLYEVTDRARIEVAASSFPVASEVSGRVIENHMELALWVEKGDVLVELAAGSEELELAEERSRSIGLGFEVQDIQGQIDAESDAIRSAAAAARLRIVEAEFAYRQAEAEEILAQKAFVRVQELVEGGLRSAEELDIVRFNRQAAVAILSEKRTTITRLGEERSLEGREGEVRIRSLERELSVLQGRISTAERTEQRLDLEVGRRLIRAPVSGRLGEVADIRLGSVVAEGKRLCTIVPESDEYIVSAEFEPSQALGRIRPGQGARLRLHGYPWAQWGTVRAQVTNQVGSEVREGTVRVVLAIVPDPESRIRIDHGLPGILEIEVERVSPAALVLRLVGEMISRPAAASPLAD